ncbi:MAG: tetratricopeptide repeat protein [Candidatus Azobacteroides sp.]|nr:tetratricopeptide repeat protein [Candidatus Azobacteroides sp.]
MQKNLLFILITALFCQNLYPQDPVAEDLKRLSLNGEYQKIIDDYSSNAEEYSVHALHYIVAAYLMLDDEENSKKYLDLSIEKDPYNPEAFYLRGCLLNYMEKYEEAIPDFRKAISLSFENMEVYMAIGDAYYYLEEYAGALDSYSKATAQNPTTDRAFYMVSMVYEALNDKPNMLKSLYVAKENIKEEIDYYVHVLFNIGLLEIELNQNYEKAEAAYLELLQASSDDYTTYAKLIQIYYHRKEYEKAGFYRDKLYEAHRTNMLNHIEVEDSFCFDIFMCNNKKIRAFEKYGDNNPEESFYKYIFRIPDEEDNPLWSVQVMLLPASLSEKNTYLLSATINNNPIDLGVQLEENFDYEVLKEHVIKAIIQFDRKAAE